MKHVMNPFLPSFEYIPDGEPHVFGNRIYLFGSHDRFDGAEFCMNDYVAWSAPLDDLSRWRYEGVIYRKEQDPRNQNVDLTNWRRTRLFGIPARRKDSLNPPGIHAFWAPDVVQGPDGRYYLYYCLDYLPQIGVAVAEQPAGPYAFHGLVRHRDGSILGDKPGDLIQFDPGVFCDEDGIVYLYSGNAPISMAYASPENRQGSQVMTLEQDMLTLKTEPRRLLCDVRDSRGTGFEGHEFFEASSIRRISGKYYFVYSSVRSHELCYAISDAPDRGFSFGGTIIDIGNCGLNGRDEAHAENPLGNTHGGIECANGQWYVFYHRQTNQTQFSRQACAEPIFFQADGSIAQVPVTSSGLYGKPLPFPGSYAARHVSHLTRNGLSAQSQLGVTQLKYPFLTQDEDDLTPTPENIRRDRDDPIQYVANLQDGAVAGFTSFDFGTSGLFRFTLTIRKTVFSAEPRMSMEDVKAFALSVGKAEDREFLRKAKAVMDSIPDPRMASSPQGEILIAVTDDPKEEDILGRIPVDSPDACWTAIQGDAMLPAGIHSLYFLYRGTGFVDFKRFAAEAL